MDYGAFLRDEAHFEASLKSGKRYERDPSDDEPPHAANTSGTRANAAMSLCCRDMEVIIAMTLVARRRQKPAIRIRRGAGAGTLLLGAR